MTHAASAAAGAAEVGATANAAKAEGAKAEAAAVSAVSAVKVAVGVAVAGAVNVPTNLKTAASSKPAAAVPMSAARGRKAGTSLAAKVVAVRAPSVNHAYRPPQMTLAFPTR